jgi:hypothetical protein
LGWGLIAISLENPALVVGLLELKECVPRLFGIPERSQPKEILFDPRDHE